MEGHFARREKRGTKSLSVRLDIRDLGSKFLKEYLDP